MTDNPWSPTGKPVAPLNAPLRRATSRPPIRAGTTDGAHGQGRGPMAGSSRLTTECTSRRRAIWSVVAFGLTIAALALAFSLLALPWSDLPWWKIFRRCVSIASAVSLWWWIRIVERRSFRSYGFSSPRAGKRQLLFGLSVGIMVLGLMLVVGLATGVCQVAVTSDQVRLWRTVLGFIPVAGLVSVLEELVFRGFILQHLLPSSKLLAVLGSSTLYALVHLKTTAFGLATWLELGGLLLLGVVLVLSYLLTNQLYLAVGLHAALAYGARVNKLLIELPDSSMVWLVGTSRIVNGLAGWVALLGIGGIVLWWARSQQGGARDGNV